jgi:hypothetical protein
MHPPNTGFRHTITDLTLALLLVTLWLSLRGYQGLTGDAQIYAFQALSRIHPQFVADLYLQNVSQDQFTVFSPFYAVIIATLGLENAARLLTLLFTAWLMGAAWSLVRVLAGRPAAWLAVAFLLIVPGDYGGAGVFRFSEQYLTARLPAEALIITALACHLRGMKQTGLLLAVAALFIHPLMALPGLLLVICLRLPLRVMALGAGAGVLVALALAMAAIALPAASNPFPVMDTSWLDVVRERSQFLFPQLWSFHDWDLNARPFVCLGLTAVVVRDQRLRTLCAAAALLGAAGLGVALIAGLIGPVALLVQGQAWRWVWITMFISALLLPMTALEMWRDDTCGPLCVLLLISGWTLAAVDGTAVASLALGFWVTRQYFRARHAACLRWASLALGTAVGLWILIKSGAIVASTKPAPAQELLAATRIRDIFGLKVSAVMFTALAWWLLRNSRTVATPAALCAALLALSIYILPAAFRQSHSFGSASDIAEFADWADAIPPTSTVLVAPTRDVGAFVWFTLQRPNYLALDQSAGAVFSRATALEVRRRSTVLLPLMQPDWKILTALRSSSAGKRAVEAGTRPLTAAILTRICADPLLGYVISPDNIGFHPLTHERPGAWKDWNLYDCRSVRSPLPAA